jgi:hypothetical protein
MRSTEHAFATVPAVALPLPDDLTDIAQLGVHRRSFAMMRPDSPALNADQAWHVFGALIEALLEAKRLRSLS